MCSSKFDPRPLHHTYLLRHVRFAQHFDRNWKAPIKSLSYKNKDIITGLDRFTAKPVYNGSV